MFEVKEIKRLHHNGWRRVMIGSCPFDGASLVFLYTGLSNDV